VKVRRQIGPSLSSSEPVSRQGVQRANIRAHFSLPLYRNGYMLLLGSASTALLGVLFWALAAHRYSADAVGINTAVVSALMLVSGIGQLGLNGVLVRYLPAAGRGTHRLVVASYALGAALSALVAFMVALASPAWSPRLGFLGHDLRWLVAFILASTAWTIFSLEDGVMTGIRQAKWVPIENSLFSLAKIVLLIAFVEAAPGGGIFLAWSIPALVLLVPVNLLIFLRLIPRHSATAAVTSVNIRRIAGFAWGNYLGSLFTLGSRLLLPIIVTNEAGARAAAFFYVPWTIALSVYLVALNMTTSLTVEVGFDEANLRHYCRRVTMQTVRIVIPIAIVCFVAASPILRLFGASYASEGSDLLRLLAVAIIPNVFVAVGLSVARIQHSGRGVLGMQAAECILAIGLSYLLLPRMGIEGVGVAWLVSQLTVAAWLTAGRLRPLLFADRAQTSS
jgi:O-antigen/teichoic acid export membrane protein